MMRCLLLGASGQLGSELLRALAPVAELVAPTRSDYDLLDLQRLRSVVKDLGAHLVINAAAYTAVDAAEADRENAFTANAEAPGVIAEEVARQGSVLIHFSTDYVFDGKARGPYIEQSPTNPLNVYGASKLAGERAVFASGANALILRTSWVYGRAGRNFMVTVLRHALQGSPLRVVDDQVGCPTNTAVLAKIVAELAPRIRGTSLQELVHCTGAGQTSWHGFAQQILQDALHEAPEVARDRFAAALAGLTPISTAEFPRAAMRPRYSVLSNAYLRQRFEIETPPWQEPLGYAVRDFFVQNRSVTTVQQT